MQITVLGQEYHWVSPVAFFLAGERETPLSIEFFVLL
jgi:hypothetical protein